MKRTGQNAFTLIELMIAVAIVGILAAIAYPSYQEHIRKSRRVEAEAALVSLASAMSQYYLDGMSYKGAAGTQASPTDTGAPWIFSKWVPLDANKEADTHYDLKINQVDDTTFLLYAIPKNAQKNDKCGTLTLNHLGTKDITSAASGVTSADCW